MDRLRDADLVVHLWPDESPRPADVRALRAPPAVTDPRCLGAGVLLAAECVRAARHVDGCRFADPLPGALEHLRFAVDTLCIRGQCRRCRRTVNLADHRCPDELRP